MTSALIIGASSLIGGALARRLQADGVTVHGTTRATLDLATDPATWQPLPKADVAYICAAITKLDACERDKETSYKVNVTGTGELVRRLTAAGTFPIFLSSNHVFDGSKAHYTTRDPTCPVNEYGKQKVLTERAVQLAGGAVLRLSKVVVHGDARLFAWQSSLSAGQKVMAFEDLFAAPLTLDNALDALHMIGAARAPGMYQISGNEDVSYYDMACAVAWHVDASMTLVERGSVKAANIPENFCPRYTSYVQTLPQPVDVPDINGIVSYALPKE